MQAEAGTILEGKVTGLTDFGAFVELEGGGTGMVHISEVAATYVKDIREHLEVGKAVKVKVLSVGENGRINLSIKKAMEPEKPQRPQRPQNKPGNQRRGAANVWQGAKSAPQTESQSFEDMMARFKQVSDEKITDLKRSSDSRNGGYSRKGGK
ncbi:MAG: S1 RNA-binding domain-containing protein [Oscillospiraceae bacterium]|nr:S1 RNA-binding domain-containing protein [Oscillospiraceae bacterium]